MAFTTVGVIKLSLFMLFSFTFCHNFGEVMKACARMNKSWEVMRLWFFCSIKQRISNSSITKVYPSFSILEQNPASQVTSVSFPAWKKWKSIEQKMGSHSPSLDDTTRNISSGIDQIESVAMMVKIMMWNMNEMMMELLCVWSERCKHFYLFIASFSHFQWSSAIITDHQRCQNF